MCRRSVFALVVLFLQPSFAVADDDWSYFQAVQLNWGALEQFDVSICEEMFDPAPNQTVETRSEIRMICSYSKKNLVVLVSRERVATGGDGKIISGKHVSATIIRDQTVTEIFPLKGLTRRSPLEARQISDIGLPEIRSIGLYHANSVMSSFEGVHQASDIVTLNAKKFAKQTLRPGGIIELRQQLPKMPLDDGRFFSGDLSYSFDQSSLMPIALRTVETYENAGRVSRQPNTDIELAWKADSSGIFVPRSVNVIKHRWSIDYSQNPPMANPYKEQTTTDFRWNSVNQPIPEKFWNAEYWENRKVLFEAIQFPKD